MRFSLRTTLIAVTVAGLLIALIQTALKLRDANEEIIDLKRRHGPHVYDVSVIALGDTLRAGRFVNCHILHIGRPGTHLLEAVHYNGKTHEQDRFAIPLKHHEYVICYCEDVPNNYFSLQATNSPDSHILDFELGSENQFVIQPTDDLTWSQASVFLKYFFLRRSIDLPEELEGWEGHPAELQELCDSYKIECVYFRIIDARPKG